MSLALWLAWCLLAGWLGGRIAETYLTGLGIAFILDGLAALVIGWRWSAVGYALAGFALILWDWWKRRGRRDVERVLGVVRDLGHRLAVVPAGAS